MNDFDLVMADLERRSTLPGDAGVNAMADMVELTQLLRSRTDQMAANPRLRGNPKNLALLTWIGRGTTSERARYVMQLIGLLDD